MASSTPAPLPNNSHLMLAELCGPDRRVLELGCGHGAVTEKLQARGCTVWAVDIDPEGVEAAAPFAQRTFVADLERTDIGALIGPEERFDRIVLGDVLEHLRNPRALLEQLTGRLDEGGRLLASVPNVAHADLRLLLMQGRWPYQPLGLLDRTHVRFFTVDSLRELLTESGWTIERLERIETGVFGTELAPFIDRAAIPDGLPGLLHGDESATTYQIVVDARPSDPANEQGRGDHGDRPDTVIRAQGEDPVLSLMEENEQLRRRVSDLSDIVEELHWAAAERRGHRARAMLAVLPAPIQRALRGGAARARRLRR